MLTQKGENTNVVGIIGNFDDAQTGVKEMFHSKNLAERMNAKKDISFPLPILLTLDVWYHRLFTTYMRMVSFSNKVKLPAVRR